MKISKGTIIRTILLAIALINELLSAMGKAPINLGNETVEELVSFVFLFGSSVTAWWKNNSFSQNAICTDRILKTLNGVSEDD